MALKASKSLKASLQAGRGAELAQETQLKPCDVCHATCKPKHCGRCGKRAYCGVACQKADWASHKARCQTKRPARCAVCAAPETATAPPCGHGLCAACDAALATAPAVARVASRPRCPACRDPEQPAAGAVLEDEVPLLLRRYGAVAARNPAEGRRLLERVAARCHAALAVDAVEAARDAKVAGRAAAPRRYEALGRLELGKALLGLGDFKGAAAALERGLALQRAAAGGTLPPQSALLWTNLARARLELRDYAGAADAAKTATALPGGAWQTPYTLGSALDKLGRYGEAAAAYGAALERVGARDGERTNVLFNRGRCLRLAGDCRGAAACLKQAVDRSPEDGAAASELALALEALGDAPGAVDVLRSRVAREPSDLGAAYNLGALLSDGGDHAGAAEVFSTILWRDPGDVQTRVRLGLERARLGDVDAARACWRKALELDPGCLEARTNLSLVSGDGEAACPSGTPRFGVLDGPSIF